MYTPSRIQSKPGDVLNLAIKKGGDFAFSCSKGQLNKNNVLSERAYNQLYYCLHVMRVKKLLSVVISDMGCVEPTPLYENQIRK